MGGFLSKRVGGGSVVVVERVGGGPKTRGRWKDRRSLETAWAVANARALGGRPQVVGLGFPAGQGLSSTVGVDGW